MYELYIVLHNRAFALAYIRVRVSVIFFLTYIRMSVCVYASLFTIFFIIFYQDSCW